MKSTIPHLNKVDLIGTWLLQRFDLIEEGESEHPWGFDMHGLLIYGASGHMSVAINRYAPWNKSGRPTQPAEGFSRLLFYAGTYCLNGNVVSHQVTEASDVARIGTVMVRDALLDGNLLNLRARGPGYLATLVWKGIG